MENYSDELACECVQQITQAKDHEQKLETIRVLHVFAPYLAHSFQSSLLILIPQLTVSNNCSRDELTQRHVCQRILCEALLPVIEYANEDTFGDGVPLTTSSQLKQTVKSILQSCPLMNLQAVSKLNECLDQKEVAKNVLQSIQILQSGR